MMVSTSLLVFCCIPRSPQAWSVRFGFHAGVQQLRPFMESHRRSLLKALSWRLLALLITFAVALLLFDDVEVAAKVGVLDSVVKIVIYYVHERAWQKVPFGRQVASSAAEVRSASGSVRMCAYVSAGVQKGFSLLGDCSNVASRSPCLIQSLYRCLRNKRKFKRRPTMEGIVAPLSPFPLSQC